MTARKAYRIQLSIPTAFALVLLGGVSLVVSFYMGVITGESMRQIDFSQETTEAQTVPSAPDLEKRELQFFSMSEGGPETVDINLPGFNRLQQRAAELRSATNEMTGEPRPSDLYTRPTPEAESNDEEDLLPLDDGPAESQPAENMARPTQEVAPDYTVQVFSSKLRKNAEDMLNMLRDRGFADAYIHTHINPDNSVLYRVRVGKVTKEQAEQRAFDLRRLNFVDSIQITRL